MALIIHLRRLTNQEASIATLARGRTESTTSATMQS